MPHCFLLYTFMFVMDFRSFIRRYKHVYTAEMKKKNLATTVDEGPQSYIIFLQNCTGLFHLAYTILSTYTNSIVNTTIVY
jgi:hypothetical protein